MSATSKQTMAIAMAIIGLAALEGCQKAPEQKAAAGSAPSLKLDESQLIQPIHFTSADIDASKNACTDLGAYANDKWLAANPIPADQVRWGAFNVLRERSLEVQKQLAEQVAARSASTGIEKIIADMWSTGMDEKKLNAEGIVPLRSRLAEIDGLKDGASIAAYLRTIAARGENSMFGFFSESDFKNSGMKIAYAQQGGTSLPDKTYYFDPSKKEAREDFVKHIARVLELSGVPGADAAAQATHVMAFETRLAKVSKSQEELSRDISLYYNPVSLADADTLTPAFSWTTFFDSQKVARPAMFSLGMPAFHREVNKMFGDVPVAQWRSYLRFRLVDAASPYLSDDFANESFDFYSHKLAGQEKIKDRWKRVLAQIENGAGEAMGQIYVQVAFPPESRNRMQQLVDNLHEAFKVRIQNLTWMSEATKTKALEKWATFTPKIGYPSKWRDWGGLATSRDSYFENMMAARAFNYRYDLDKIGKPTDKSEWTMTPQTVNAYYNPLQNEIVFPAAILQPPFFDPKADDALNYGAIGAVIGHEITHGYDDQGARFGPTGNFEQWWTPQDAKKFAALTGKLVRQYSGYTLMGEKVNGNLTLGENIADLGGLNIAYDALQRAAKDKPDPKIDGLTRDQRFFLGFAAVWRDQIRDKALRVQLVSDPHSPPRIRANGTPPNLPSYAEAFGCKPGDPMSNADDRRVVIW
jgi:putative endopeptidase